MYIYKNMREEQSEEYSNKNHSLFQSVNKNRYLLGVICHFTQHKSRILFVGVTSRGMIVSIDKEHKVYISEICFGKLTIFNYF